MSKTYNNEIVVDFTTGEVQGDKYTDLINKAYDRMNKADFKDFTLELIGIMTEKMDILESDCDRLEEAANEALDELEMLAGKFNELLQAHIELKNKTKK